MPENRTTFRFDDISVNSDLKKVRLMTDHLLTLRPVKIIYGISPLVVTSDDGRVFPSILNAFSDYRAFYTVNRCGIPNLNDAIRASHGLIHVDHRLLTKEAQEMSILVSCNLIGANIFIPPFNKWNKDTENICEEYDIELIKFEDGWNSMEYNKFDPDVPLWYLHSWRWTFEDFKKWFER